MNADGTDVKRLTATPGEDRGTSWTSDGRLIVFHSARNSANTSHSFDVFTMKPDGSDQTMLVQNGSAAYVCGDSTNGVVVFNSSGDPLGTNPEGDFEIFTVRLDGSALSQVTDNAVTDSGPKWSPDCTTISCNSTDLGGSLDVHRINADGTGDVNLTNTPGTFDAFSAWSPDGTRIVFTSDRQDDDFEIYTMSAQDGSDVVRLTSSPGTDFRPDWGIRQSAPSPTVPEVPAALLVPVASAALLGMALRRRRRV